jgi:hypothetical protein
MKRTNFFTITLLFCCFNCAAQVVEPAAGHHNFDTWITEYQPEWDGSIPESQFNKGKYQLENALAQATRDSRAFIMPDYWNFGVALINLGADDSLVLISLQKAVAKDQEGFCDYLKAMPDNSFQRRFPEYLESIQMECSQLPSSEAFDLETYCMENDLDQALIQLLQQIQEKDGRHRSSKPVDWDQQGPLDQENQRLIDSLYQAHGSYIGTTLAGEKFASTMFLVIQHSNLEMMERYLPVLQEAVRQEELQAGALHYLIDRIYAIRDGYQIFGSQVGIPFGTADQISAVKKQFGIK